MQKSDYTISEVTDLPSFSDLMRVVWTAYHQPYKPYFNAYNPVFGPTRADREAAILDSIETQWAAHQSDPNSTWICIREKVDAGSDGRDDARGDEKAVVSEENDGKRLNEDAKFGKIVAGCQWRFFTKNPYLDAKDDHLTYDAGRWPEGSEGREFVTVMLKKHFGHQRRWLRRPHASE